MDFHPFRSIFTGVVQLKKEENNLEKEDKAKRVHTYTHKRYLILVI